MKILYRDYIAMIVAFMISMFMAPEIMFPDVKMFGLAGLIVIFWYLGATRTTQTTGKETK